MSRGHGSSRRQAYGRRMKDVRTRRGVRVEVDLDGPSGWTRGQEWDPEAAIRGASAPLDEASRGARSH